MHRNNLLLLCLTAAFGFAAAAFADRTLLILYTGDIHDHVRPGIGGVGGLPYVAGYVQSERAKRPLLLVDAGDVMEKGDMVATATVSAMTYEAMTRIGYNAGTVGNHDADYEPAHLKQCVAQKDDFDLLCINWPDPAGTPYFPPSKIVTVDGIKIGIIGATRVSDETYIACGEAMQAEAKKLDADTDLIVAICHFGTKDCLRVSKHAPGVNIFVAGHTHEVMEKPITSPDSGAIIVSAGSYARYVGRLEIAIRDNGSIAGEGRLVEMRHDAAPCDPEILAWVRQREQELCPEAPVVVAQVREKMGIGEVARVAAAAIRQKANADIAFCHPGQVMRENLLPGPVDVNALFLTGGQRGRKLVSLTLAGRDIENYLRGLGKSKKSQTQWAGFRARVGLDGNVETDLEPDKIYRVVMPEIEWTSRCKDIIATPQSAPEPVAFDWLHAVADYAKYLNQENITLDSHAKTLADLNELKVKEKAKKQ